MKLKRDKKSSVKSKNRPPIVIETGIETEQYLELELPSNAFSNNVKPGPSLGKMPRPPSLSPGIRSNFNQWN